MIVGKPPKPGRIPCVIGGCGRTAAQEKYPDSTTMLCGKCFRFAPRRLRRRATRIRRIIDRLGGEWNWTKTKPGSPQRIALVLYDKTFDAIELAIVQAKAGIA